MGVSEDLDFGACSTRRETAEKRSGDGDINLSHRQSN
jgi:hypothetical protein